MMPILHKLLVGDYARRTRFHDEKGNLVGLAGWVYAPHAYLTAALKQIGYRPKVPWISYRARNFIDRTIQPNWRIVEFGSGGSTLWFAKRGGYVHSIESDPKWYALIQRQLEGLKNVRYECRTIETYANLSDHLERSLDFVLIDGEIRGSCAKNAIDKVKAGGMVYLDNSDKDMTVLEGEVRLAEKTLLDAVGRRGGEVRYFVDFAPTNGSPTQGMLVRLL
jgi:predicted O-methyltransferase YrrM